MKISRSAFAFRDQILSHETSLRSIYSQNMSQAKMHYLSGNPQENTYVFAASSGSLSLSDCILAARSKARPASLPDSCYHGV